MKSRTINLERNLPTASEAMLLLSQELRLARCARAPVLKVIHGYGSSGKGGAIKAASLKLLEERRRAGQLRHYVRGEDFTPFTDAGRRAVELCPELRRDLDYGRQNDGITIVIL